jgi:hypothetical protein
LFITVLLLEIKLSRGEGCYHINRFNPRTFLCLSQARTWISIIIRHGLFMFNDLRWELIVYFVNIGGIVDHHCLNFLIIKDNLLYYILYWWTMNNVDIYQRSFIFYLYIPSNPILISIEISIIFPTYLLWLFLCSPPH